MNPIHLSLLILLGGFTFAHAETITIRNKTVKNPQKLYVSQYQRCGSKSKRLNSPIELYPSQSDTQDKLNADLTCALFLRFGTSTSNLPSEMDNRDFDDTSKYVNHQAISRASGVQSANITDYYSNDQRYESYTDTREALMSSWPATWRGIWNALTTAGDTLTITNNTGQTMHLVEYEYFIGGGDAKKLGEKVAIAAGATYKLTKAAIDPGYNDRFVKFDSKSSVFPETIPYSDYMPIGGARQRSGQYFYNIFLYVKSDGTFIAYTQTGLDFKKLGCELLLEAVNAVASAASYAEIPDAVTKAIGLDALLKPAEDAISQVTSTLVATTDLATDLQSKINTAFGGANFDSGTITSIYNKMNNNASSIDTLFTSANFCDPNSKTLVIKTLTSAGMNSLTWANLVPPDSTGGPMLGASKTTSIQYKTFKATFTTSHVLDFNLNYSKVLSIGLGVASDSAKVAKVDKAKSVEFYPHVKILDLLGPGVSLGLSGQVGPFSGITGVLPTNFSKLVGVSLGLPNGPSGGYTFDASTGYSWTMQ